MTMPLAGYPRDLNLTVEDIISCGWNAALAGETCKRYSSMSAAFVDAVKQVIAKPRTLDKNGVKTEIAMRSLMGLPEARKLVGRDLSFKSGEDGQQT